MPVVLVIDCPHCSANNAAFVQHGDYADQGRKGRFWGLFECPRCHGGVAVKAESTSGRSFSQAIGDITREFAGVDAFPKRPPIDAPEYLPAPVQTAYLEAAHCLRDARWNAAAMMFRRAIELSVKSVAPEGKGDLRTRIDALAAGYAITPAMQEWAHHIRLEGNAAAHDLDEFSDADAKSLQAFTELFVLYLFTLPQMLELRRKT